MRRHIPEATYPEAYAGRALPKTACFPIWSCSEWGLPCHQLSLTRCALTAPFHPYHLWRYIFCGTVRELTPPRRYLALCPVEPGLSSTAKHSIEFLTTAITQLTQATSLLLIGKHCKYFIYLTYRLCNKFSCEGRQSRLFVSQVVE